MHPTPQNGSSDNAKRQYAARQEEDCAAEPSKAPPSTFPPLTRRSRLLYDVIDMAPDAIVVIDAAGHIRLANRATESLFGYGREELQGKLMELLVPEAARERHVSLRVAYFASESPQPRLMRSGPEFRGRRRDGSEFPIELALSPIRTRSALLVAAAVRDATEREHKEQEARHSQRMEAIGRLSGGVAHEFNNLLQAILGYSRLVIDGLEQNSQAVKDLQQVVRAGERAAKLAGQLLAFGRKETLERHLVDPNQLVNELLRMVRPLLGEDIDVILSLAEDLPPIFVDRGLIEQSLLNLCINGRDAMPHGGTLMIATRAVRPEENAPPTYVAVEVSDTGEGIPPHVIEHIFEPFFTTKKAGSGTGLGLAMVHGIVKQHQGDIRVLSEVGKGTRFVMQLPAGTPGPAGRPHGAAAGAPPAESVGNGMILADAQRNADQK